MPLFSFLIFVIWVVSLFILVTLAKDSSMWLIFKISDFLDFIIFFSIFYMWFSQLALSKGESPPQGWWASSDQLASLRVKTSVFLRRKSTWRSEDGETSFWIIWIYTIFILYIICDNSTIESHMSVILFWWIKIITVSLLFIFRDLVWEHLFFDIISKKLWGLDTRCVSSEWVSLLFFLSL